MNFQNPTFTPAAASTRIRTLWRDFESSQAKDRAQLDRTIQTALEKAEAEWNKTPNNDRMGRIRHSATKAKIVKTIKTPYFEQARAMWHQKLESLGLKVDYWTDLTEDEKRRITNTLGADDESDDEPVVVSELPPPAPIVQQPTQSPFFQPLAPSFSTSSRATNLSSSSYALVNPSEFNSEDEDFEFEIPFSNPVATSADLTSEDDDDAAFSIPGYPAARSNLIGSGFSRSSSSQNSASNPSKPPSTRPLVSGFAYNAALSGTVSTKRHQQQQQVSQNEAKPAPAKARIPRQPYVGPSLDAADEPVNEELEFEKFKMRTRMAKIVEFHEAAALAEISLSIEIYKARKQLNNSKEEDAPRVLEHQKRMVQLQKEKEEERKAIVKSERARRQSDLGRRLTPGGVKEVPTSKSVDVFKTWELSSFQEEMNIPSRFNLDTLLSDDPANVENLLSEMFADDSQPYPESSVPSLFNSYSSASSNPDAFGGSASVHGMQEHLRHSHSSMSWNRPRSNPSPKPSRKSRISPFGESSDEEDEAPASVKKPTQNTGWGTDQSDVKPAAPIWTNKPNGPTTSAWSSKDVGTTPVSGAWSSKQTTAPITQPRQGSKILSNPNSFFDDETQPEPTATPIINSKVGKGKKAASDKSPVPPPTAETITASSKAPAGETPAALPAPVPIPAATPAPAPAPVGKKQNKKQRQANKKAGAAATSATTVAETSIPEKEPETEPVLSQRESPKLETPMAVPDPVVQDSEHVSWVPKTLPAMARARMDSGATIPSFSWDEITSTPRPSSKIPAHVQETLKSEGTPRPSMLRKQNLMASATSSRTTLEQMPLAPVAKGSIWAAPVPSATPGPSLWGKTKADFENVKVAQQPVVSDFWVPGGFDGVDYKEGDGGGGGGGGGDEGASLWESIATQSKQTGKATSIPVKQQQPSVGFQRLRRVSEAASSSPAPRPLGSKDLSDIGQPAPPPVNSNSKKTRGKKNGKGKQRVTVEDVSDEEKDNIDILPQESNYIMESKVILEPKPSVPPFVYNPIIDFAGNNNGNDIGYSSSSFRPTASTSGSSPDDFFSSESRFSSSAFKPQSASTSIGTDWAAIGGKHARWTPAVNQDREESDFPTSVGPRLQAKPGVQQTPIWGQPNPSVKDKGKGKK